MSRPTVLVADDHSLVAECVCSVLEGEFESLGVVADGVSLLQTARRTRPDVVVSDVSMPGVGGFEALRQLRAEGISSRVIFLTQHADPAMAGAALRAGAAGYVLKESSAQDLLTAIRKALAGQVYVSPRIADAVLAGLAGHAGGSRDDRLTSRQSDVLKLIADGMSMKQIAAELQLSRRTVEGHKYEIMQQLGIETTAGLVRYAVRHGLAEL